MNFLPLFIGLRYTVSRKQSHLVAFISRISTAGMVLAVMLLITVSSVMNGFDQALREKILSLVPHATLTAEYPSSQWPQWTKSARQHDGVMDAVPFSYLPGLLMAGQTVKSVLVYGIDPNLEPDNSMLRQLLTPAVWAQLDQSPSLVLGVHLAKKLQVGVGDSVQLMVPSTHRDAVPQTASFTVLALVQSGTELDE